MSMSNEEKIDGLKIEVLELKDRLADSYYTKSEISRLNLIDEDKLKIILGDYSNSQEISNVYLTKLDFGEIYKVIDEKVDDYNNEVQSKIKGYVTINEFQNVKNNINYRISDLENNISYNFETVYRKNEVYTKKEIDDKKFLTEHQDISNLATQKWVESKKYLTKSDIDDFASKDWILYQFKEREIDIDSYLKKDDIGTYIDEFVTIYDVEGYINSLDILSKDDLPSLDGYVTSNELKSVIYCINDVINEVDKKLDINGVNEYINSLNIDEIYAKKSEIPSLDGYVTISYLSDRYARKSEIPDIESIYSNEYIDETFVSKKYLEEYLSDYVSSSNLDSFVTIKYLGEKYARKSEIPDISLMYSNEYIDETFLTKEEFDGILSEYTKDSSLSSIYAKKSDLISYVKTSTYLEDSKNFLNCYQVNDMISKSIDGFVKSDELKKYTKLSDFNLIKNDVESNKYTISLLSNDIKKFIRYDELETLLYDYNESVNTYTDNVIKSYLTISSFEKTIAKYVKNDDIKKYITKDELDSKYITKDELDSLSKNLLNYVQKSELRQISKTIYSNVDSINFHNTEINSLKDSLNDNYYTNSEIDYKILELEKKIFDVSKITTNDIVVNNTHNNYALNSDLIKISQSLSSFVREDSLPDFSKFITFDKQSKDIEKIYEYIKSNEEKCDDRLLSYYDKNDIDVKLSALSKGLATKKYVDSSMSEYLRRDDIYDLMDEYLYSKIEDIVKSYVNKKTMNYITKAEADLTYLAIEDYKHFISDGGGTSTNNGGFYKMTVNEFNNTDTSLLNNGMYIVGNHVLLIYDGRVIELRNFWRFENEFSRPSVIEADGAVYQMNTEEFNNIDASSLNNGIYIVGRHVLLIYNGTVIELKNLWRIENNKNQ